MRECITLYQGYSAEQLTAQFRTNTNYLKVLIPTNQKYEHSNILKSLANNPSLCEVVLKKKKNQAVIFNRVIFHRRIIPISKHYLQ